jgi:hypothetical protein
MPFNSKYNETLQRISRSCNEFTIEFLTALWVAKGNSTTISHINMSKRCIRRPNSNEPLWNVDELASWHPAAEPLRGVVIKSAFAAIAFPDEVPRAG